MTAKYKPVKSVNDKVHLRGKGIPNQNLAYFECYLKIVNTLIILK